MQHPLLKNYIRFFWQLKIDQVHLYHKIIPQRNINLRINLSDTPHYLCYDKYENITESCYFSGIQDQFRNIHLKVDGKVDVFGICFHPDGFYPFFNIPVSEFKNQILGLSEAGISLKDTLSHRLNETKITQNRIYITENVLLTHLIHHSYPPDNFRKVFNLLKSSDQEIPLSQFCRNHNLSVRTLERMFNKYVGISASSYFTLDRFHNSLNHLLSQDYSKLSDLAYDNGYYDQMHFIKEFKRFAGNSPKNFMRQNDSLLNIGKLI